MAKFKRFEKYDNSKTVKDVIERNTGLTAEEFLKEEKDLYIHNLNKAATFISKFIEQNPMSSVVVIGDYDSDGINATTIMYWGLRLKGVIPTLRLPSRFSEGFGLNEKIIDEIDSGLLITVDNGITAYDAVKKAKEKGLSVVIIDHHLPSVVKDEEGNISTRIPPADVIIDPAAENVSDFHNYCGATLAYRLVKEMFPNKNIQALEVLASIATVTDVMPLIRENRTIVKNGLKAINDDLMVPGLKELLTEKPLNYPITEYDYGFSIGPCFNACGRLYDNGALRILQLLTSGRNDKEIHTKAIDVVQTNKLRQRKAKQELALAKSYLDESKPIVVYDESFSEGIVGITAGRLCEEFHCPTVVFAKAEQEGMIKGSGRSIPEINLKDVLDKVSHKDGILTCYGGHAGAAGLSIPLTYLEEFKVAFKEACGEIPSAPDCIHYDLETSFDTLYSDTETQDLYAPYGEGNPKPIWRFEYRGKNPESKLIGDDKSHFMIKDRRLSIMGFGLAQKWQECGCPTDVDMVGYLSYSIFRGEKYYKFEVIDFKPL